MTDWKATLNGSSLCGGDCTGDDTVDGCLLLPPDGLGVPSLRVEDLSYPQRDGVEHFADWYEPRIITLTGLIGGGGCGCDGSNDVRARARNVATAWSRQCDDVELVLTSDCTGEMVEQLVNGDYEHGSVRNINPSTGNVTLSISTTEAHSPTHSLRMTRTGGGSAGGAWPSASAGDPGWPVTAGDSVSAEGWFKAGAGSAARTCLIEIVFYDLAGNILSNPSTSALNSTSAWTFIDLGTHVAPTNAARVKAGFYALATANGEFHYLDDISVKINGPDERRLSGPFGARGRPRVGQLTWRKGKRNLADFLGRFDSTDQRLYILGQDAEPGSGAVCSSINDAPGAGAGTYGGAVQSANGGVIDSHWPLDFLRIYNDPALPSPYQRAEDIIGSADAQIRGGYFTGTTFAEQGPPISWNLSASAVVGPAQLTATALPNPYSNAAFGWWQQVDGTDLPSGAGVSLGTSSVGKDAFGNPSPEIRWGGTNVAMNADVQDAFGFTNTLRNQPVLIVLEWNAGGLGIFAGHENSGATKLLQSVATGGFPTPAGSAPNLTILGRVSNAFLAINGSPSGETITDTLTPYAFDTPTSQVVLPDVGELCGPIQVTFEAANNATFGDIYIFKEDGTYVGIEASGIGVDNPSSLDTAQGTARGLFDTTDFTPRIIGDPFLQVNPGESLQVFGGAADSVITICFRPSVISA